MTIRDGRAFRGAAIINSGNLSIIDTTLTTNEATSYAGAVLYLGGTSLIERSTIANNTAIQSPALQVQNGADLTIINSTIANNTISGNYGGLIVTDAGSTATITNSTISGNQGTPTSVVVFAYNGGTINLNNSILANTIGGPDCGNNGGTINFSPGTSNIIEQDNIGSPCGTPGTNYIQADPLLGPLADNGGTVQTMALQTGSPAIEAGNNAASVDATAPPLTTDARGTGFDRFLDGVGNITQIVDIGAFEAPTAGPNVNIVGDVTLSEGSGGTTNFTFGVTALAPVSGIQTLDVMLTNTSTDAADFITIPATVTILDGQTTGSFTIAVDADSVFEPNEAFTVTISNPSAGITLGTTTTATGTINNDDIIGITLSPIFLTIAENGGTGIFTVVLDTQPTATVTVPISSSDTGECTVSPASLTFNPSGANLWSDPQTITVTGVDDSINRNDTCTITVDAASGGDYAGYDDPDDVAITLTNDDIVNNNGASGDNNVAGSNADNSQQIKAFDPSISKAGILLPGDLGLMGERLEWRVTVINNGTVTGTNVVFTDTLRDELQIDDVQTSKGTPSTNGQTVTINIGNLSPGEIVSISIFTTVLASDTTIDNTACIASSNGQTKCVTSASFPGVNVRALPSTGETPWGRLWGLGALIVSGLMISGIALRLFWTRVKFK